MAMAGVLLPAASSYAAVPENDAFSAAIELTAANSPLTGSTVESTAEPDEPWHVSAPARHSVWFTYTADSDRSVTLDTCGSRFDTLLAVYEGDSVGSLRKLASNDDAWEDLIERADLDMYRVKHLGRDTRRIPSQR